MSYQISEVIKALNIPRERFKGWVYGDHIKGSVQIRQAGGKGRTVTEYDLLDVYAIALFKHLIEKERFKREAASRLKDIWLAYARTGVDSDLLIFARMEDDKIEFGQVERPPRDAMSCLDHSSPAAW